MEQEFALDSELELMSMDDVEEDDLEIDEDDEEAEDEEETE
ncbi:MAG: hypothetical protein AAB534_03505 [Patescibacteria group bacterium]